MSLKKHLSSFLLVGLVLTQLQLPGMTAFRVTADKTSAAASGDFQIEGADLKYQKTWIMTITCRTVNGGTETYAGPTNLGEMGIPNLVAAAIRSKNLPYTQPTKPLVSSDGGGGVGNVWTIGTPHEPTLNAVCKILGSAQDTYTSFTCHDGERGAYPAGKCNYHSPGDNQLMRFVGTFSVPQCQDGLDNDNDGALDLADFSCQNNPNDNDETNPKAQCQDGIDNDNDGLIDAADPRCHTDNNPNNPASFNPQDNDEGPQDNPQFTASKTADVQSVRPGGFITYTINVRNTGQIPAQNIRITDDIPSGLTFVSQGSTSGCSQQGGAVVCQPQTYQSGESRDTFLRFQVPQNAQCGGGRTVTNRANIQQNNLVITQSSSSQIALDCASQCADGIDNDNDGAIDLADFSCQNNPNGNDETNPKAQCQDGLDNDNDGLIDAADPRCHTDNNPNNPASFNPQDNDEGPQDNPQFTASKTADVQSVRPGGFITYTINVRNTGQIPAQNIRITDDIPSGLTFVSQGSTSGCSQQGGTIVCQSQTYQAGQSSDTILRFQVAQNAQCGGGRTVTNRANIQQNNLVITQSSSSQIALDCEPLKIADLQIVKAGPPSVVPGGNIIYTLTVFNHGPDTATNVAIQDIIPAGLTFNPAGSDSTCILISNSVVCDNLTLTSGTSKTVNIAFAVPANATCNATIINTASVATSATDPNPNNNQSQAISATVICPAATFAISKTDNKTTAAPGETLTYTVAINNTSQTDATGITVTDTLPQGVTFVSASNGGSFNGSTVIWTNQSVPAGTTVTRSVTVTVNQNVTHGTVITNTVQLGNQTATDQTTIQNLQKFADLQIVKSGPVTVVRQTGSILTYSIIVSNAGPDAAANVNLTDLIPQGLSFVSAAGATCAVTAQSQVACSIGTVNAGQAVPVTLTFRFTPIQQCTQTTLTNTATITSTTTDPNTGNNQSTFQTQATCPVVPTADIAVVKLGNTTAIRGQQITYTFFVTNFGPDASSAVLSDNIPADLQFISSSGGQCSVSGNILTCNISNLLPGHTSPIITATFMIQAQQNCLPSNVLNTATIQGSIADPNSANNTSTVTTLVNCPATLSSDLILSKTGPVSVAYGQTVVYSLSATNVGPSAATNVVIRDAVPTGMIFVSGTVPGGSCSLQGADVRCTIATLAANQSVVASLVFTAPAAPLQCTTGSITNQGEISSDTTDPNAGNNQSAATVSLTCLTVETADVGVIKTGPASIVRGNVLAYNLFITNNGTAQTAAVVVTDVIPAGLSFNQAASSNGCSLSGSTIVKCTVSVAQSSPVNLTLAFDVPAVQSGCTTTSVTNTASIRSQFPDPNASNNQSSASVSVTCPVQQADLSLTKTAPSTVVFGSNLSYTLTVNNAGPAAAGNVKITDPVPAGLTYASASGATCQLVGSQVVCNLGSVNPNASSAVTLNFTFTNPNQTCSNTGVTNTAILTSDTSDTNASNNQSTATTAVTCPTGNQSDITVFKTDNRSSANVGERLRYSIILTNAGANQVGNITVTDSVPTGMTILTVSDGGSVSGQQVTWNTITVQGNSSRTLFIDVEVRSDVSNGTILRNTVNAAGKTATDDTTIANNVVYNPPSPPPYYPPVQPPYYPPIQPPYYPPVQPPYYPPVQPPVYYPPKGTPVYPLTGTRDGQLYADRTDSSDIVSAEETLQEPSAADNNVYNAVFYATLLTMLAVGSAAASRFLAAGI